MCESAFDDGCIYSPRARSSRAAGSMGLGRFLHDLYGVKVCFAQLYPRSPTSTEPPVFFSLLGIGMLDGSTVLGRWLPTARRQGDSNTCRGA